MAKQTDPNPLGYTISKAADKASLSPSMMRKLVINGTVPAIKVGKRWIVPAKALEAWFDQQTKKAINS